MPSQIDKYRGQIAQKSAEIRKLTSPVAAAKDAGLSALGTFAGAGLDRAVFHKLGPMPAPPSIVVGIGGVVAGVMVGSSTVVTVAGGALAPAIAKLGELAADSMFGPPVAPA
jgi:hypothetical protein